MACLAGRTYRGRMERRRTVSMQGGCKLVWTGLKPVRGSASRMYPPVTGRKVKKRFVHGVSRLTAVHPANAHCAYASPCKVSCCNLGSLNGQVPRLSRQLNITYQGKVGMQTPDNIFAVSFSQKCDTLSKSSMSGTMPHQ